MKTQFITDRFVEQHGFITPQIAKSLKTNLDIMGEYSLESLLFLSNDNLSTFLKPQAPVGNEKILQDLQQKYTLKDLEKAHAFYTGLKTGIFPSNHRELFKGFNPRLFEFILKYFFAISFVNTTDQGSPASASSYSFNFTVASGTNSMLFYGFQVENGSDTITSVKFNSVDMTRLTTRVVNAPGNYESVYIYYMAAPPTGTHAVDLVLSTGNVVRGFASQYDGVHQTVPLDSEGSATHAAQNTETLTTTVLNPNCWLIAFGGFDAGGTASAGTGATERAHNGPKIWIDSNGAVATGTRSMIYNETDTSRTVGVIAAIKPPVAANASQFFNFIKNI